MNTPLSSPSIDKDIKKEFQNYFLKVAELLIDCHREELEQIIEKNLNLIEQFLFDQNIYTFFIQKLKEEEQQDDDTEGLFDLCVHNINF